MASQSSYLYTCSLYSKGCHIPACDWLLIRWILPNCCSESAPNCGHSFWLTKLKITPLFTVLSFHFIISVVTALQ